jgi:phosphate transport system substrate-binding protein
MYLGHIKMWNDGAIKKLNPGMQLPALPVAPVYRADSSGTSNIFTTYLASVDLQFSTIVGAGSSVNWVKGVGAKGNDGVAGAIRNTRGGFGYVEYAYASENHMATPMLQNRSGKFVTPTMASFAAASAVADWAHAANMAASMINTSGPANWPIVSATYIEFPKNPSDPARAANVLKFFDWSFKNGADAAAQLHYIMLPPSVQAQVRKAWAQIKVDGRPLYTGS